MKKLTFIAAFAMSLFCVLGSPSVYAQEQQGRKPAMRKVVDPETSARELTDRMKEELKLTEKQYKKVYKLNLKEAEAMADENKPEMPDLPKELARMGYAHIAFSVGSKEKVDALTIELKTDGYEVISGPRTTGDGYYESCIVAIEGNQIEITV